MPTLGNTDPDFIMRVDEAQREVGIGISDIVALRKAAGVEGNLLDDVAPGITWEFTPAEDVERTPAEWRENGRQIDDNFRRLLET